MKELTKITGIKIGFGEKLNKLNKILKENNNEEIIW